VQLGGFSLFLAGGLLELHASTRRVRSARDDEEDSRGRSVAIEATRIRAVSFLDPGSHHARLMERCSRRKKICRRSGVAAAKSARVSCSFSHQHTSPGGRRGRLRCRPTNGPSCRRSIRRRPGNHPCRRSIRRRRAHLRRCRGSRRISSRYRDRGRGCPGEVDTWISTARFTVKRPTVPALSRSCGMTTREPTLMRI